MPAPVPQPQPGSPSYRSLARFFFPLAFQAASQSITYPLVAMVASQAPGGTVNLAGLAQSNSVMFILATLGAGLQTAGMVYGKSREGFESFKKVNRAVMLIVFCTQLIACIPPLAHLIFGRIIGLPPSIESPAYQAMLASLPLHIIFFMRNPYLVTLYNNRETAKAGGATFFRIIMTLLLAPLFCAGGLVGPVWAPVCLTLPVIVEMLMARHYARPYIQTLKPCEGCEPPRKRDIMLFNIPMAVGSLFLSISGLLIGAFMARAGEPERTLPAYYLALGLASPMTFAATRIQATVLAFPPSMDPHRRVLRFSCVVAMVLGLLPLLFTLPGLADLYYIRIQNLDPADLPLVRMTALFLVTMPFCVGFRAYTEGVAAHMKRPVTVLTGQAVYLGIMASTALFLLSLGTPGNLLAPIGLIVANFAAVGAMRISMYWDKQPDIPVPATRSSSEGSMES
ncbi:MAG: hypothetical protein V1913_18635 [Fibrobacterota bacterium]